jgi:hypothetical protein
MIRLTIRANHFFRRNIDGEQSKRIEPAGPRRSCRSFSSVWGRNGPPRDVQQALDDSISTASDCCRWHFAQ